MDSFAQWLKDRMESHGISNYQLSRELGCHQTSIANWLSGKTFPQRRMKFAVEEYFSHLANVNVNKEKADTAKRGKINALRDMLKTYDLSILLLVEEAVKAEIKKREEVVAWVEGL
jgi:transcriptional regulator with XRE-family HTH domain